MLPLSSWNGMPTATCKTRPDFGEMEHRLTNSQELLQRRRTSGARLSRTVLLYILAWLVSPTQGEFCHSSLKGDDPCFCDVVNSPPKWTWYCNDRSIEKEVIVDRFTLERMSYFKISCNMPIPYKPEMFYDATSLKDVKFVFEFCNFPQIPFAAIANGTELRYLRFVNVANSTEKLDSYLFHGLHDSLVYLDLRSDGIGVLPEDIFYNLTALRFLSLRENKLVTLPEFLLANLTKLRTLDLSANNLEYLPEKTFSTLSQLKALYLYRNRLETLPSKIFQSLSSLNILELSRNRLKELPAPLFHGLVTLNSTTLQENRLTSLPEDIFYPLKQLELLDLSSNPFNKSFSKEFFTLKSLKVLKLTNCSLQIISEDLLSHCENLTVVVLNDNNLHHLPSKTFRNNTRLTDLNLSNNSLEVLPDTVFSSNPLLKHLRLSQNNISVLPKNIFKETLSLESVDLKSNSLISINNSTFGELRNLRQIYLNRNKIVYFSLGFNEWLEVVDLSYNSLESIPNLEWLHYLHIKEFNLEHNRLSRVAIPVMHSAGSLRLGHNNISTVLVKALLLQELIVKQILQEENNDKTRQEYTKAQTQEQNRDPMKVYLYPNPFVCDCEMTEFSQYALGQASYKYREARIQDADKLTCHKPAAVSERKITALPARRFTCHCTESYPEQCQCDRLSEDDVILNCSGRNLSRLPAEIPRNTKVLYFRNNELTSLDAVNTPKWQNVEELYLDNNRIVSIGRWKNVSSKLKTLSLRGNQLSRLSPEFLNSTGYVGSNLTVALGDNPWDCGCSARPLKSWLNENSLRVADLKNVSCSEPVNGSRALVATVPDEVLCPPDDWPYKVQLMSITAVCVVLALLLFVVSVLYYKNKQTVVAYVYIHFRTVFVCFFSEQDMDEDKIFDAFVSYSSSDRDVALALINELEKKDPSFRLCIHERDWMPGNLITWNIVNSVQNSKRTILVISKDFLESMWFQVEFHTAYYQMLEDRINRLIVIVKGELPPKESLDKDLQYLISTKTYLIWGERWMWEKLRYAMPHRKQPLPSAPANLALGYKPNNEMLKTAENKMDVLSSEIKKKAQKALQNGDVPMVTSGNETTSNNNKATTFEDAQVVIVAQV